MRDYPRLYDLADDDSCGMGESFTRPKRIETVAGTFCEACGFGVVLGRCQCVPVEADVTDEEMRELLDAMKVNARIA